MSETVYEKNYRLSVALKVQSREPLSDVTKETIQKYVQDKLRSFPEEFPFEVVVTEVGMARMPVSQLVDSILKTPVSSGLQSDFEIAQHHMEIVSNAIRALAKEVDNL